MLPCDTKTEGAESAQDTPRPDSQYRGDLSAPEGQRAGNDTKTGARGRREKEQGMGKGYLLWRDKGLLLEREETDIAHGQTAISKRKKGNPVVGMSWFVLIGHVN